MNQIIPLKSSLGLSMIHNSMKKMRDHGAVGNQPDVLARWLIDNTDDPIGYMEECAEFFRVGLSWYDIQEYVQQFDKEIIS